MAVVIDEVDAVLDDAETPARADESRAPGKAAGVEKIRHTLFRLEQREGRLRAD